MSSFKRGVVVCNPIVYADYVKAAEARKWLADRGLPSRKLRRKSKPNVLARILKLESSYVQHVIADALNNRSASANARAAGQFARLSTELILFVADFLSLGSMSAAAMTCRFLRHRLSLSLNGPPSPGLAALRSLQLGQRGKHNFKPETLKAIFSRSLNLRSLSCDHIDAVPLPNLLRHLRIHSHTRFPLELLQNCKHLQTLHLSGCEPQHVPEGSKLWRSMKWPELRTFSLRVERLEQQELVPFMLLSAPKLEELAVYCDFVKFTLPVHSALKRFKSQTASISNTAVLAHVNIQELDLVECPQGSTRILLPNTLVRLSCDALSMIGPFGFDEFTALRQLRLWVPGKRCNQLLSAFKHSRLPALESLALEFTFHRVPSDSAQVFKVLSELQDQPTRILPRLAKLDLLFMQSARPGLPPGVAYLVKSDDELGFEQWTPDSDLVKYWQDWCKALHFACTNAKLRAAFRSPRQYTMEELTALVMQFELNLFYMTVVDNGQGPTAVRKRAFPVDIIDIDETLI